MSAPSNINVNAHIASSALDAQLDNVRSKIPPSVRAACLPDSASTVLRNLVLAMAASNAFLFLGSLFATGTRFMTHSILVVSLASVVHVACVGMVLGNHVADVVGSLGMLNSAAFLRESSARHGSDPFLLGALLGSTLTMAVLMQVVHSFYGDVAECVSNQYAFAHNGGGGGGGGAYNLTGGYAQNDATMMATTTDVYGRCGASVSSTVGFVSFVSGLLRWIDVAFAAVLYVKRRELLSGEVGVGPAVGGGGEYDEIGGDGNGLGGGGGFAGDFPSSTGMRTLHV